jgi:hypothetical protein
MKNFDIETYARKTLEGSVISPKDDTWRGLSDKLDTLYYRKRKKIIRIKAAIFIALFAYIPSATLNSDTARNMTGLANHHQNSGIPSSVAVIDELDNGDRSTRRHRAPTTDRKETHKEKNVVTPRKKPIRLADTDDMGRNKRSREYFLKNVKNLEMPNIDTHIEVTDAEVDSLMERARQNLQMERALQEAREVMIHQMLADVEREISDIEGEIEAKNAGFYQNIKRSYTKLKTVISN